MLKKFLAIILIFSIIMSNSFSVKAEDDLAILSQSAILIEASTGTVLYEKNADEKLKPASVTKVMTLLLIFEALSEGTISYDDTVTVSAHAASMGGSQCFFEQGEQQTVRDMIKCIEVASGNDAAVAMAEHIAGSEEAFVKMMNDKAAELDMVNTHFENACGLDADGHLTTARDISIMSRELIVNHPDIFDFSTIWMDSIVHRTARGESQFDLANTNKFLNQYTGANGLKTGYTSEAGYCMSATAERNGIQLIAVIMKADTKDTRNNEAGKLLDYGFSKCDIYVDENVLEGVDSISVKGGTKKTVRFRTIDSYKFVLINESGSNIEKSVEISSDIQAPVKSGDVLGKIVYKSGDMVVDELPIVADENIAEADFLFCLKYVAGKLFIGDR